MGSLADTDPTAYLRSSGTGCSVANLYARLDADDEEALRGWFANPNITTSAITRALKDQGYDISESATRRHRTGGCKCEQ